MGTRKEFKEELLNQGYEIIDEHKQVIYFVHNVGNYSFRVSIDDQRPQKWYVDCCLDLYRLVDDARQNWLQGNDVALASREGKDYDIVGFNKAVKEMLKEIKEIKIPELVKKLELPKGLSDLLKGE